MQNTSSDLGSASQLPIQGTRTSGPASTSLPKIILLEQDSRLILQWNSAIKKYFPDVSDQDTFSVVEGWLGEVEPEKLACDCIVSPANSFGIMDGAYDDALSENFLGPDNKYWTLTNQVQAYLREDWNGYLPPGSCVIVPLPEEVSGQHKPNGTGNRWGATTLACLPTMRTPENVTWHRDLVYNCMWSLLAAVKKWNKEHDDDNKIKSLMMTGLATGTGGVSAQKCAEQMILAVKHFAGPQWKSGHPRWGDVGDRQEEIASTI